MRRIGKYIRLYPKMLGMAIKSKLAYRVDLFFGATGFLVSNTINFLVIMLIVAPVQAVGGWSIEMIMFLYGFLLLPKGIDHLLTNNLWYMSNRLVERGEIDKYLTKPLSPLFQVITADFEFEGLGEVILGILLMAITGPNLAVSWSFSNVAPLVLCDLVAVFAFSAIKLFTSSFAFFFKKSMPIMNTAYSINEYAKYPLKVFGNVIGIILLFVLPFSMFCFMPVQFLLFPNGDSTMTSWIGNTWFGGNMWALIGVNTAFAALLVFAAISFFYFGLRHYESAGS